MTEEEGQGEKKDTGQGVGVRGREEDGT